MDLHPRVSSWKKLFPFSGFLSTFLPKVPFLTKKHKKPDFDKMCTQIVESSES